LCLVKIDNSKASYWIQRLKIFFRIGHKDLRPRQENISRK